MMAKRLRHYNGQFGPVCPDGWRRVEVGETLRKGDRFWSSCSAGWYACLSTGEVVNPGHLVRIRRIESGPDQPPSLVAPEPSACQHCAELRAQLTESQREVEDLHRDIDTMHQHQSDAMTLHAEIDVLIVALRVALRKAADD